MPKGKKKGNKNRAPVRPVQPGQVLRDHRSNRSLPPANIRHNAGLVGAHQNLLQQGGKAKSIGKSVYKKLLSALKKYDKMTGDRADPTALEAQMARVEELATRYIGSHDADSTRKSAVQEILTKVQQQRKLDKARQFGGHDASHSLGAVMELDKDDPRRQGMLWQAQMGMTQGIYQKEDSVSQIQTMHDDFVTDTDIKKGMREDKTRLNKQARDLGKIGNELRGEWLSNEARKSGNTSDTFSDAKKLGSGQLSEVFEVTQDGEQRAFKPDLNAVGHAAEQTGVSEKMGMLANREVATYLIDQLLGTNVIPKTEFAEVNITNEETGEEELQQGSIMDMAPGKTVRTSTDVPYSRESEPGDDSTYAQMCRHIQEAREMLDDGRDAPIDVGPGIYIDEWGEPWVNIDSIDKKADFKNPNTQKGLANLQIIDIITGQLDRHAGNYHIDDQGNVKGFDNDLSFGRKHTDPNKKVESKGFGNRLDNAVGMPAVIDRTTAQKVLDLDEADLTLTLMGVLPEPDIKAAIVRLKALQAHIRNLPREAVVDRFDESTYQRMVDAGEDKSYVGREVEERKHVDHLMTLATI